jgi:hypothetical protein
MFRKYGSLQHDARCELISFEKAEADKKIAVEKAESREKKLLMRQEDSC